MSSLGQHTERAVYNEGDAKAVVELAMPQAGCTCPNSQNCTCRENQLPPSYPPQSMYLSAPSYQYPPFSSTALNSHHALVQNQQYQGQLFSQATHGQYAPFPQALGVEAQTFRTALSTATSFVVNTPQTVSASTSSGTKCKHSSGNQPTTSKRQNTGSA